MYPFAMHSLSLSTFSSVIGPFGGFFASGFKRAFKIKVKFMKFFIMPCCFLFAMLCETNLHFSHEIVFLFYCKIAFFSAILKEKRRNFYFCSF